MHFSCIVLLSTIATFLNINRCVSGNQTVAYPYSASIRIKFKVTCVGAILTKSNILTLCDCVRSSQRSPSDVTVRVGILSKDAQIVEGTKILCHKQFVNDRRTPNKNIAVVQTKPFRLGYSVKKITLPDVQAGQPLKSPNPKRLRKPRTRQSFTMVGWMYDEHYYTLKTDPGMRTWIRVGEIAYSKYCTASRMMTARYNVEMYCAEFFHQDTTDCIGDRGTLMVQSSILWGMMSYRFAYCGLYQFFVPYIDVSSHLKFIVEVVSRK